MPYTVTKWAVADSHQNNRVVLTTENQGAALSAAQAFNAGWPPFVPRFVVLPAVSTAPFKPELGPRY